MFATEVRNCAGNAISLGVWSAKGQRIREIYVEVPKEGGSIGVSLQWVPLASTEDVWHILDVAPNSPADVAGLLPYADYVIGSPEGFIKGEAGLGELVEQVRVSREVHRGALTYSERRRTPDSSRLQQRIRFDPARHHHAFTLLGRTRPPWLYPRLRRSPPHSCAA